MEKIDTSAIDAEMKALNAKFNEKVVESYWSENGELVYILQDGTDLKEYAEMVEKVLNDNWAPEIDYVCKVMHADEKNSVSFNCDFDAKHIFEDLELEEDEPMNEYDTLEDFKLFWNDDVASKFNDDREVEFPVSEGVDLNKAGKLIIDYVNQYTKLGKSVTVILFNLAGNKEKLMLPANS